MKGRSINCPYCYSENRNVSVGENGGIIVCSHCGQEIYVAVSRRRVEKPVKKSFLSSLASALFSF